MALVEKNDIKQIFADQAPSIDKPASFANYPRGWDTARPNNGKPTIKQFNYLQQRTDQNILWMHQNGAALPYDATMEYAEGAVVVKDGKLQQKQGGSWVEVAGGVDPSVIAEIEGKADRVYVDSQLSTKAEKQYIDDAVANNEQFVNGAISNLSTLATKLYPTLAEGNADIANLEVNQPVQIGEAANGGLYYKATEEATTLTKSPYDPAKIAENYTNTKTDNLNNLVKSDYLVQDQDTTFKQSLTDGVFGADFVNKVTNANLSFVGGNAAIMPSASTDFIRSIYTSRQIIDNTKRILNLKFKIEDVATTTGAAIFIGELLGVIYYSNGTVAVINPSFAVQSSQSVTNVDVAYSANESVELEIVLNADGSGTATAKKSSGKIATLAFTGLQKGKVYLATRRLTANKAFTFERFSIVEKSLTLGDVTKVMAASKNNYFDITTDGYYAATTDAKSSQIKYAIANNVLTLDTTSTTSNAIFYAKTGHSFVSAAEFEYSVKVLTGTITAGMSIVVGDGANRKVFAYLKNGFIGTMTNAGGTDQGAVSAAMAYENGSVGKMRLAVSADGDAILTAVSPTGLTQEFNFNGVISGNVYPAWRGSGTTAELYYFNKTEISPSTVSLSTKLNNLAPTSKFPKTWKVLPDSEVGRTTKGFTCTGLAKITAGQYRECWAVGDDGRLEEADGSPFKPRIHILDGAFNQILLTIDPLYTGASLQGVAFDTLTNEHLWVACSGNETIRKFSLVDGLEVVADQITVASLGISLTPNAIAFDATQGTGKGALWVGDSSGLTVYLIDCDPLATTRIIKTITVANNPDQFQLIENTLLYQSAGNGTRASVYNYNLTTDTEFVQWQSLECWFAAEGFYYDQTFRTLYALNDAGYHKSIASGMRFNCVIEYSLDY